MPSRRAGAGTVRRKPPVGNLRRAHPASGATWNVQVVRGKMSSKCLWHACRALVLGLTLMLLGAGMATIGYYADYLSTGSELRGNATVRVKNDLKGLHLNNLSYVGPIVMGFGGFIVVASCVMTFEARDSAAKVVPARFRAATTGSKTTVRSNQSSATSQRRAIGIQLQTTRWDQQFGVFRTSPAEPPPQTTPQPFDRDALTAELIKFSKSLSASARFSPQLRRLTHTGSVPNLSTHAPHPIVYSTNLSHLLSPNHKPFLLLEQKRHHRHHHRHHHHHHHQRHGNNIATSSSGRQVKARGARISNSLVQRNTRENGGPCTLLQPPTASKLYWHAASFDDGARTEKLPLSRATIADMAKRSDTAKRHVLARQKPIEHEEDKSSPLGNRRSSTMSDSSYSGRGTARCASMASRASSIDSRRVQVDLHSPEVIPKSILRSPKRYSSGPSATPSVEKEFRSQLSVCSEPPAAIHQLSGQSSLEPCFPEESIDIPDDKLNANMNGLPLQPDALNVAIQTVSMTSVHQVEELPPPLPRKLNSILKKARPDTLSLTSSSTTKTALENELKQSLCRSNSARTFYRPKPKLPKETDDSIFYIRSASERHSTESNDLYDSVQVINERRTTLLRTESEAALSREHKTSRSSLSHEHKTSRSSLLAEIPERTQNNASIDVEDNASNQEVANAATRNEIALEIEPDTSKPPTNQNEA